MKFKQFIIALDQLVNTLCDGWADETLSARAWRNSAQGKRKWTFFMRAFNKAIWWQNNHCRGAFHMEQERLHMPPAYRDTYNGQGQGQ